jgi:hypothetical protein
MTKRNDGLIWWVVAVLVAAAVCAVLQLNGGAEWLKI